MAYDYKKEYKELYMPNNKPSIVTVPKIDFIAVRGCGNPNEEGGEYKNAIGMLYNVAFTIKMSKKGGRQISGYFDYVVPPLEGFWWQDCQSASKIDHPSASKIDHPLLRKRPTFDHAPGGGGR